MARLSPSSAREILRRCSVNRFVDFHTLSSGQVEQLLVHADEHSYRQPKNAKGSRGRCWCVHLQRVAQKED